MTFTEAAAQVLRLVGKPLHYKEITDVAIEKNLLSHVGKSPEVTMGARLAALVKKGDKENPLVRIKPGVFALREWDQETIEKGLKDRTPALERLSLQDIDFAGEPEGKGAAHVDLQAFAEEGEPVPPDAGERARAELAAHGAELFESEEDDDQPIFGEEAQEAEPAPSQDGGRRRRRPRRRGGRGDERISGGGDDLPSYTVSDAPLDLIVPPPVQEERETGEVARVREAREPREPREAREPREGREAREPREPREPREAREPREGREPREAREPREGREAREPREAHEFRESRESRFEAGEGRAAPLGELSGRPLADAIESLLGGFERSRGPVPLAALVDSASRKGRLNAEQSSAQALIVSAVRADSARRSAEGRRPRFRISGNKLGLWDWQLDSDLARAERDLNSALDRYREAARRSLLRSLQELPQRAFGELAVLVLEQLGYTELTSVRRPGAHGAELHLSGRARTPSADVRTAIVIRRDGREIGRERVTELRGALHHYGPAQAGLLLTSGQVLSGAREEAAAPAAAPVTVADGITLTRWCEEHSLGVAPLSVRLPLPDTELLDGLRSA